MHVIVIGAEIGGLTTAHSLGRAGLEVVVYEQAQELREVGAGIHTKQEAIFFRPIA